MSLSSTPVSQPRPTPPKPSKTAARRRAEGGDAAARILLNRLSAAVEAELHRRRIEAELDPADSTPVDIRRLSSISADLTGLAELGMRAARSLARRRPDDLVEVLRGLSGYLEAQRQLATRRATDDGGVDDFGFDQEWTEGLLPMFNWLYSNWWRVQVRGIEHVPATGGALLVSNHAGVLPYDGAMIRLAVLNEHPTPRHLRPLALDSLFGMPWASWLARRTGNTIANYSEAAELVKRKELVLVFPEGSKTPGKPYRDRYRLRRFGRGEFAELAMRTSSPIVPVSVVGSEEIHPVLADIPALARALGQPYAPITPTFPWLGPLGLVPLPSSWIIEFHAPVTASDLTSDGATDPGAVMRVADHVRETIQAGVYSNLERRGSVFAVS